MKKLSKSTIMRGLNVRTHIKGGQTGGELEGSFDFVEPLSYEGPSWCEIQEQTCFSSADHDACTNVAYFCRPY